MSSNNPERDHMPFAVNGCYSSIIVLDEILIKTTCYYIAEGTL